MTNKDTVIDTKQIISMIPHRYPFLLVDKITGLELKKSITGIKNVTANEPQFMGHFPENPVMPGVLIIESMAQISAVLVAKSMDSTEDKEVLFLSIDAGKFRSVVRPGDCLVIESEITQSRGSVWKFKSLAKVDGQIAAEASFTAMVKNKEL